MGRIESLRGRALEVLGKLHWLAPLLGRLAVGLVFMSTGWGKVHNIEKVTGFFTSLHIPAPHFQAILVGYSELVCGTALVVGLLTRLATVPLIVDDDVEAAADRLRGLFARFIGGMGPRGRNFHYNAFVRMGYEEIATRVRDLWLEGRAEESAAAIPTAMIEQVALIGPAPKIRDELVEWRRSLPTTLLVHVTPEPAVLRQVAELVLDG